MNYSLKVGEFPVKKQDPRPREEAKITKDRRYAMKTIVGRTLSVHKEHEFLLKLETAGLDDELAQIVIGSKNNNLAAKVVRLIQNRGFMPTTSQKRARKIMRKNFFGVEEVINHFGIDPTDQQLATLSEIPFSEAVLKESKNTHILVAVFPFSILEIYDKSKWFCDQSCYNKEFFARECSKVSWQLVSKTPVSNLTSRNWEEQQAFLGKDNEVPTAQVMVYTIVGYYLVTGERLFEHFFVRTSSLDSVGDRVYIGYFSLEGLRVKRTWSGERINNLGVSSARLPIGSQESSEL